MSVHREKISKDKQRFIDRFGQDLRLCSSCFEVSLKSLTTDPETKGEGGAISPLKFQKHAQLLGSLYRIKLQSYCLPPKISAVCGPAY